ncbi:MAG TPA: hypothetical protein PLJ21_07610 [Pseudobdellovibrionaceae bacterium]|nr:hypothetical protein [Pseudobdellovibrionaceae bacterium]
MTIKKSSLYFIFVIFLSTLCSQKVFSQEITSKNQNGIVLRGLENIPMDEWTQLLLNKTNRNSKAFQPTPNPTQKKVLIVALSYQLEKWLSGDTNLETLFSNILTYVDNSNLQESKHFKILAYELLVVREQLRTSSKNIDFNTLQELRQRLYLLQMMAEEVLYIGYLKWPEEMSLTSKVKTDFSILLKDLFDTTNPQNLAKAGDFTLQTGDIVLSKATGNGSSFFITSIAKEPTTFSHSALTWIDPNREWPYATLIEALMEDGTKLRKLNWLEYSKKTRIYVYRYEGLNPKNPNAANISNEITELTEQFVNQMKARVTNPYTEAAFGYDISMSPESWEGQRYFCSAVSWSVFNKPSTLSQLNPYDRYTWSAVDGGRALLLKTLEVHSTHIPAPGDIELNSKWSLVGLKIKMDQLSQERIEAAIVESLLNLIENNKKIMQKIEAQFDQIGDKPLTREDLQKISTNPKVPEKYRKQISDRINDFPENANLKQIVFFFFLNEILTPQLRTELLAAQSLSIEKGKVWGPLELRRQAQSKVAILAKSFEEKLQLWLKVFTPPEKNPKSGNCTSIIPTPVIK